jgi:hypothetical protein
MLAIIRIGTGLAVIRVRAGLDLATSGKKRSWASRHPDRSRAGASRQPTIRENIRKVKKHFTVNSLSKC